MTTPQNKDSATALRESIHILKKENRTIGRRTLEECKKRNKKENIILGLINECEFYEQELLIKENNFQSINKLRHQSEDNKNEIQKYCAALREELKDFVTQVENFETKIDELKRRRQQIIKSSEAVIAQKKTEQEKLEEQLFKVDFKIEKQLEELSQVKLNHKINVTEKETQFKQLSKEEKKAIDKFNCLRLKFNELTDKYNLYQTSSKRFMVKDAEQNVISDNKEIRKDDKDFNKEEYDIQIAEAQLKKENLIQELSNISLQINKLKQEKELKELLNKQKNNPMIINKTQGTNELLKLYKNLPLLMTQNKKGNSTYKKWIESTMMSSFKNTLSYNSTINKSEI
jgi:hypothetical protein